MKKLVILLSTICGILIVVITSLLLANNKNCSFPVEMTPDELLSVCPSIVNLYIQTLDSLLLKTQQIKKLKILELLLSKTDIADNKFIFYGTKEDFISNELPPEFINIIFLDYMSNINSYIKSNSGIKIKGKELKKWRRWYEELRKKRHYAAG